MFGNIGLPELFVIALFGLVIFGPDRLPKAASDAAQLIKRLRAMSHGAMSDFRTELGPEFSDIDLRSLHPRRIVEDAWNTWDHDTCDDADEHPVPVRGRDLDATGDQSGRPTSQVPPNDDV